MPVADDPAALLQPFRLQCTHVQGSNSRHRDGENLRQIKRYLPEVALAQSSRRGSITLPKLRIALGIQADDEPNRWSVASVPKQFAES